MNYSNDLIIKIVKYGNSKDFIIKEVNLKEYEINDFQNFEKFI